MKKSFKFNGWRMLVVLAIMLFVFSSCKKEDEIVSNLTEESGTTTPPVAKVAGVSYIHVPGLNVAVPNSPPGFVLTGNCGSHSGGVLSAKVMSQSANNGDQFTIRVFKQGAGGNFNFPGTAYIKEGSVCGNISGSKAYLTTVSYVDIPITAGFPRGLAHYYPMTIEATTNQYRYFAEPILIHTNPMYDSNWTLGTTLGTVNGVVVKCNGTSTNQSSTNTYQCTEFCARYYQTVYGRNFIHYLAAKNWFGDYTNLGDLERCTNNGSKSPRPGDILCMESYPNTGNGHVAIIVRVESNYILIAHQNSGTNWAPIGASIARNGNKIDDPPGYKIQGWLRMPQY
ncbi:MAG: CHAP domain-containing protein [Candidatus Peribacteria bacterium]|jgi:hypothetical protein|nr:CHAP domain-containing protein [Candidatus Peribacteria bacterium]